MDVNDLNQDRAWLTHGWHWQDQTVATPTHAERYVYNAEVIEIRDGDSFTALVDLGFGACYRAKIRLVGCNARERDDPGGLEATGNLVTLIFQRHIELRTVKPDKFGGRWDAAVRLDDGRDLTDVLISTGWAAAWNGTGTPPVPPWPRPMQQFVNDLVSGGGS